MTDENLGQKFSVYGIKIDREKAEILCCEDFKWKILVLEDTELLEIMLLDGWSPKLSKWSDQDIQLQLDGVTGDENIRVDDKGEIIDPL